MISLERRLHVGLAVSLVSLMGMLWVVGNHSIRGLTEGFVAARLRHDAQGLVGALVLGSERTRLRWRRVNPVYYQPLSGHYYFIRLDDGREFGSRSLGDHVLEVPRLAPGESRRMRVDGPEGQLLLLLLEGFRKDGQEFTLAVAEDLTPIKAQRDLFRRNFALLAVGGLLAMLLLQSLVVRRSLRSLDRVREDVRRLEQGRAERLSEEVPAEILPLVQELNRLLTLVAQRLERSRNALGNLAHALKRPLNLLIRYLDDEENGRDEQQRIQAGNQAERIHQLMDRELKRARLAGQGIQSRRFDPQEDLADLVAVLQQLHQERSLQIHCRVEEEMPPFGDREDMLELLGNLLDNACKWAVVRVSCHLSGAEEIHIGVADDGAGLSDEDLQQLTQRGSRLDESVEGHGLGLAIARDIVKLYGGTLELGRSEALGGLQIRIVLPGAGAAGEPKK